jgi:hypothetical protein
MSSGFVGASIVKAFSRSPRKVEAASVPRDDTDLALLLEKTQRLLDERNAERFAGLSGVQIMREAERRNADAVLSRDDSLPGGFRIRFVPKHVPAYLDPEQPSLLRKQAD